MAKHPYGAGAPRAPSNTMPEEPLKLRPTNAAHGPVVDAWIAGPDPLWHGPLPILFPLLIWEGIRDVSGGKCNVG